MSLGPEDIARQRFSERFRGYDEDEVDAFLDALAERLAALIAERGELLGEIRRLEQRLAELGDSGSVASRRPPR